MTPLEMADQLEKLMESTKVNKYKGFKPIP